MQVSGRRRFAAQWRPNYIKEERRLVLTRLYWNRGNVGDGKGHSNKLSVSFCWSWRNWYVGLRVTPELWGYILWFNFLCFSIRIHKKRSWGGSFI